MLVHSLSLLSLTAGLKIGEQRIGTQNSCFLYKIHFSEVKRNNMSSVFTPLPSRRKSFSFSCSVLYPFYCQGTFSHLLPNFVSFFYICCVAGHGEQAEGEGEGRGQEQGEGEAAPHREH
jgi:hypothetical protein